MSIRFAFHATFGFGLVALLFVVPGCSGDTGPLRVDVNGKATFAGNPIPVGEITFIPDSTKGNSGPATNVSIKNGEYSTVGGGKGIVGGPHKIHVIAFDGVAKPAEELPMGTPLFPEYVTNADLPKAAAGSEPVVHDIAVPAEAVDGVSQQVESDGV